MPFFWREGVGSGALLQFGYPCDASSANGVNEREDIVGFGCDAGHQVALLWQQQ